MACLFVQSSVTVYAEETELPDTYIKGVTQAEDIEEGYTYQFVEFDNMYLENVVIGTPDEIMTLVDGEPNVYKFSGNAKFSSMTGSTAGYNSTTNNYNFIANGTILIPLDELTADYEWLINEEYTFKLENGYVNVSSNLGGLTASYNPSNYNTALLNQRKFVNCGTNFRPLSNEIITLDYTSTINGTVQTGSVYVANLDAVQYSHSTSFKVSNITGDAVVTYTGDVSDKKYYLAVNFTKGFSASGSSQTSIVPNSEAYISNGTVITATSFDFPYSGEITITYELPVDESIGLLNGIIEWVKGIYDSIVELPARLWSSISEGLKELFIPNEEDMIAIKEGWDDLLSSRFGAIYESGELLHTFYGELRERDATTTITIPEVTLEFSGVPFTFGGYQIDVIPDGFEFLVELIKGVMDIVCTLMFIDTMRRKYDELVR